MNLLRTLTRMTTGLALLSTVAFQSASEAQPKKAPRAVGGAAARYVADELLVKFNGGAASAQAISAHAQVGATVQRTFSIGWQHVKLPKGLSVAQGVALYKSKAGIKSVEPNYIYQASATPNDPRYNELYGMAKIEAPTAWNATTGSSSVVIAVVDTGVLYTHEDLAANMWKNPGEVAGNGVDDDSNGYIDDVYGIDAANGDSDPIDDQDHGSHVAGTIAGVGNNGKGVAGVNWTARIMALKFLDANGSGNLANAITCLQYATMMKNRGVNVRVANHSWGGGAFSQALKDAFDNAGNAGILHAVAAGNDGYDNDATPSYPASYTSPSILAVAASDQSDQKASFSQYGATSVDLAAPGVDIVSTVSSGGYASFSGTSMATPHVAGAAGLLSAFDSSLSMSALKTRLMNSVDPLPQWAGKVVTGGRLNIARAISNLTINLVAPADNSSVSSSFALRAATSTNSGVSSVEFARRSQPAGFTRNPNLFINDNSTITDSAPYSASGNITEASVSVNITHTYRGDLLVTLIAPDGTRTILSNYEGGSTDNIIATYDVSTALSGKPISGTWKLEVNDNYGGDTGTLNSWSMNFSQPWVVIGSDTNGVDSNNEWTFNATDVPAGVYELRARAISNGGGAIDTNTNITVTSAPPTVPNAPSNLGATAASSSQINLNWTDNSSNESGFKIERSPNGSSSWTQIATVAANVATYSNTGLAASTTYFYRVRSYITNGADSTYSNTASATTSASSTNGPPSNLVATTASSSQINLSWTDNSSNESGFKIERSPNGSSSWTQIATVGANVSTYSNTGLAASTAYYYRVRSYISGVSNSAYSNIANATTSPSNPGGAPAAPSNLSAAAISASQINLTWSDNSSDESGFKIERSPTSTGTWTQIAIVGANVASYSNTGLNAGTTYFYRVRSYVSGVANSAYSNTASATTSSSGSTELIVDNADASGVLITGTWTAGTSSPGFYASNYLSDGNAGKGTKSVRFTPNIPVAGNYAVYGRWTAASSRASNVPFDIINAGSPATVTVNQQTQGGTWVLLGTYAFNAGTGGSVSIGTTGTNGYVIADAVRFVLSSGGAATTEAPASSPITLSTAGADSDASVTLTFTGALDDASAGDATNYSVRVNGQEVTVETAACVSASNRVVLGLSPESVRPGDKVSVTWNLRDAQGRSLVGQTEALTVQ